MATKAPFIATVYLNASSQPKAFWQDLQTHITEATGAAPTLVNQNATCLVMLIEGEFNAIVKALDDVCQEREERWLLAQVGTPCTSSGLAKADAWIRSHSQVYQKHRT